MRRPKVPEAGRQPKGLRHPLQAQHMSAFFSARKGRPGHKGFHLKGPFVVTLAYPCPTDTPPPGPLFRHAKGVRGERLHHLKIRCAQRGGGDAICISLNIEGARRPSIRSAIITSVGWPTIRTRETFSWVVVYSHNLDPGHCRMDFSGAWDFLVSQSAHSFADKLFLF